MQHSTKAHLQLFCCDKNHKHPYVGGPTGLGYPNRKCVSIYSYTARVNTFSVTFSEITTLSSKYTLTSGHRFRYIWEISLFLISHKCVFDTQLQTSHTVHIQRKCIAIHTGQKETSLMGNGYCDTAIFLPHTKPAATTPTSGIT